MTGCLQEGDWRAYLDGELPDMAGAGEHLNECAACRAVYAEVAGRASRVSELMMDLDATPVPMVAMVRKAARRPVRAWVTAGLAVAAALAAVFVLAPQRVQTVQAPTIAQRAPEPEREPVAAPPTPPVEVAASAPRVSRPRVRPRKAPRPQYYLALDDQPIETGTVMRVAFESGGQADVIVDSDGRPRAIRAVR